jgi:hypothetical protein
MSHATAKIHGVRQWFRARAAMVQGSIDAGQRPLVFVAVCNHWQVQKGVRCRHIGYQETLVQYGGQGVYDMLDEEETGALPSGQNNPCYVA